MSSCKAFSNRFDALVLIFVMAVGASLAQPVGAQNGTDYMPLIDRIKEIKALAPDDPAATLALQGEAGAEITLIASLSGDTKSIEASKALMEQVAKGSKEFDDEYIRDHARAYLCMAIASLGQADDAERKARAIELRMYRSLALGLQAGLRLHQNDLPGFEKLANESLKVLDDAVKVDKLLPIDERDEPGWISWVLMDYWISIGLHHQKLDRPTFGKTINKLAVQINGSGLDHSAKAEALLAAATCLVSLQDQLAAATWLKAGDQQLALAAKKAEGEEDGGYMLDSARLEYIRLAMVSNNFGLATAQLAAVEDLSMRAMGQVMMGAYLAESGQPNSAKPLIKAATEHLLAIEKGMMIGFGVVPGEVQEDTWYYDDSGVYWDAYYIALDIARAGGDAELKALLPTMKSDAGKIGLELGWARARQHPTIPLPARLN